MRADARRGRPRVRQLGPGRHGGREPLRPGRPGRGRPAAGGRCRGGGGGATTSVSDDGWSRPGRRSNGDAFTVESIGRYHLHDVVHHLWDVAGAVTVAGYDQQAAAYRAAGQPIPDSVRVAVDGLVAALPAGSRVLEIGSGSGRDAAALEAGGLSVRRTDITPGFVELLRADGFEADVLDPLTDDLADPARPGQPYDAVWASASLLHVARADLPVVLRRLADVTRADGLLRMSVKEGDGEGWSTHGSIPTPRRFVYWREQRAAGGAGRERLAGARRRSAVRACAGSPGYASWPFVDDGAVRHTEFWSRMEAAARHGLLPGLGAAVRDRRPRPPHRAGGAGRRRAAEAGVAGRLAEPSSCRPASDDRSRRLRRRTTSRGSRPARSARWCSPRPSARSASRSASPPRRCWPATSRARRARQAWPRPPRCWAPRSRRTCWPG